MARLTSSRSQSYSSQEIIAGQRFPVPDCQFQARIVEIIRLDAVIDKRMIVVRIERLLDDRRLPLGVSTFDW